MVDQSLITADLDLPAAPGSAVDARRFVRATLSSWDAGEEDVLERAQLVVSELVTNAVLYAGSAGGPSLHLELAPDAVRVAVHDGSAQLPTYKYFSDEALTGRGLGVVATASRRWGVEPERNGKTVWAELSRDPGDLYDATSKPILGRIFPTEADIEIAGEQTLVRFIDVPVNLYLSLDQHHDAVLREFELMSIQMSMETGGASKVRGALPDLARRIRKFLGYNSSHLRSRVQVAASEGRSTVELDMPATPTTLDATREWTSLMDEADRLAARGMLLVSPPSQPVVRLRRWLLAEMEAQVLHRRDPQPAAAALD